MKIAIVTLLTLALWAWTVAALWLERARVRR
jgi:hypothetical protein